MSTYHTAIDQTTTTLDQRAKHFRNLIVAVTFVGLGSILWAGLTWSWLPLSGTFLLMPFCGLYLFYDERLLNKWRQALLSAWDRGEIDLSAFHDAMISISTLPTNSIQSMLATLPHAGDIVTEQGISSSTRKAASAVITTIDCCRSDLLAYKTAGFTVIGTSIIVAIAYSKSQPLFGVFAVGLIFFMQKYSKKRRLNHAIGKIQTAQQEADFNLQKFTNVIDSIQWPISATERQTLKSSFSKTD